MTCTAGAKFVPSGSILSGEALGSVPVKSCCWIMLLTEPDLFPTCCFPSLLLDFPSKKRFSLQFGQGLVNSAQVQLSFLSPAKGLLVTWSEEHCIMPAVQRGFFKTLLLVIASERSHGRIVGVQSKWSSHILFVNVEYIFLLYFKVWMTKMQLNSMNLSKLGK